MLMATNTPAQVLLTEVMFDPAGNENYDEFIEIYNAGEIDAIPLQGWQIGDQSETDALVSVDGNFSLRPGQYAVILDAGYFANSGLYAAIIPPEALVLTINDAALGNDGLSNSTPETIVFIAASGDTIAKYKYSFGNLPGHSDEKIALNNDDSPSNWGNSQNLHGTPGSRNSLAPPGVDLALGSIRFSPLPPQFGQTIRFEVPVHNLGLFDSPQVMLRVELEPYSQITAIDSLLVPVLAPADSVVLELHWLNPPPGRHGLIFFLPGHVDENPSNDSSFVMLPIGYPARSLIINEILYDSPDEAEWIELFNRGDFAVDVRGWRFSDASNSIIIPETAAGFMVPPGEFLVLSGKSELPSGSHLTIAGFPTLNNTDDRLTLHDFNGALQDSVHYFEEWGGGDGISLERINPELGSNEASNWSGCVLLEGSTPNATNSIFAPIVPTETIISVAPNPFSPDGDGHDDVVIIQFQLPVTTATVHLKIFDMRGRLVRQVLNNAPTGATHQVIWNGDGDNRETQRMGIYVILLQAVNDRQGVVREARTTVVLAKRL
jgi:hypothetical protein